MQKLKRFTVFRGQRKGKRRKEALNRGKPGEGVTAYRSLKVRGDWTAREGDKKNGAGKDKNGTGPICARGQTKGDGGPKSRKGR